MSSIQTILNYFAIGSMMNKVSLKGRDLHPIESVPAIIQNYKLSFFGKGGMAEAVYEEGASFHGVLHKITESDMFKLDKVEFTYDRVSATAHLYDGTLVEDVYVYIQKPNHLDTSGTNNPPSERYIDLLILGCQEHGVVQSHIDWLKQHPCIPRPLPAEFLKFDIPEGLPTWTIEDVQKGDGKDENPIYFAQNGKVREYIGPSGTFAHHISSVYAGKHMELVICKVLYDPKYGMYDRLEDFTREHCAYLEDMSVRSAVIDENGNDLYRIVALINQPYADYIR